MRFDRGQSTVNELLHGLHHRDRVFGLEDIPSHVHA